MMKDLDNDAVPSDRECRPILNIKDDYRRIMVRPDGNGHRKMMTDQCPRSI